VYALLSPLAFAVLLALAAVASWRRLSRSARVAAMLFELLLLVAMTPFGANLLVWQLEAQVPAAACAPASNDPIVVLSAGLEREPASIDDFAALSASSLRRALAGATAWRQTPQARLVFAGGGPFSISESAVLQRFAESLGVPAAAILREERSQTTWENAEQLRALAPPLPATIRLVSSALHLPRAVLAFRAAGFEPCVIVAERRYHPPGGIGYYLPQSSGLSKSEAALHEIFGTQLYRWRAARGSG
jgi:uncharacterized SAM-binding protein YcdF (DUF218 family)